MSTAALFTAISPSFAALDDPEIQRAFTRADATGSVRESRLVVDGMYCARCAQSVERALLALPGVSEAEVNVASGRARIVWDAAVLRMSSAFEAIAALGYRPFPVQQAETEIARQQGRRLALWRLFVAGFCMMQVMMYASPAYFAQPGEITADIDRLLKWGSWMLCLPLLLFSSGPFFSGAWRDLRARRIGMDVPVALGIAVTFGASSWALFEGSGEVYFDSLAMFVFFLLAGRHLQAMARDKALQGLEALARALPTTVQRLPAYPAMAPIETVPLHRLRSGDVVRCAVGEAFAGDGVVLDGRSAADESILTGESRALPKGPGDAVIAGSYNLAGPLVLRLTRLGSESRFGQMVALMERAAAQKPDAAALADRYAGAFLAAVLVLAAAAGLAWWAIEPARALWVAVSVLIVTCPCALSLATPAAVVAAAGRLARDGVLVCQPAALERLAQCDTVVFDKTGTLTAGSLQLAAIEPLRKGWSGERALAVAAALEAGSLHPIAQALRQAAGPAALPAADAVQEQTGVGISGQVEGHHYHLGAVPASAPLPTAGTEGDTPAALLADDDGPVAVFRFAESVQPATREAVERLHGQGWRSLVLSGDRAPAVQRVAAALGIHGAIAEATPEDKLRTVAGLQAGGHRVLMVGDGLNDGPVLARADVSVSLGSGAPLSQARADLVLLSNRLDVLPAAVDLARRMRRIVRQNLAWAAAYNAVCVPLALLGYLPPWLAGLGMALSSLAVTANALRLSR
jgi:Cu2+-exporting ATPase